MQIDRILSVKCGRLTGNGHVVKCLGLLSFFGTKRKKNIKSDEWLT